MSIPHGHDAQTGYMDFSLALREMKKGKWLRRAGSQWSMSVQDGQLVERWGDSTLIACPPTHEQVLATDWEEVL